jgi:hypothetical protein
MSEYGRYRCALGTQTGSMSISPGFHMNSPFGAIRRLALAALENWKDPTSGEWMRAFAIITTDANELIDNIHNRMPLIRAVRL